MSLLAVVAIAAILVASSCWWWVNSPLALKSPSVDLTVEAGSTPKEIARDWVDAGVQTEPWLLYQWFKLSGQSRQIKAGGYEITSGATPRDLLRMMVRGDESLSFVKLIDGWTFLRFREELNKADGLKHDTTSMTDQAIMTELGMAGVPAEGRFYPDTYAYTKGTSDLAVMRRALHAMQKQLDAAWASRRPDLPIASPEQALILASIVEKETGTEADRPKISAVFNNRLRIGMPLQTDPTVIYGLGEKFDGNLRKIDLLTDTPFNTYTRKGLPPTPIAMPGKAALLAAVNPADSRALYFVARGDGSSEFSATLAEHNRAVNLYQRNPRKSP